MKAEIGELRSFIENANEKYDDVLKKLKEQEKQNKEIIKENQFLKSTVKARTGFPCSEIASCM